MLPTRRLLSIAHSYVVGTNRRLAHEMDRAGGGRWHVTAVAPRYFHGGRDLRPVAFSAAANEPIAVETVSARFTQSQHLFAYCPELRKLLRKGSFDLVHQWEEPYVFAGAQISWWTPPKVPLVFWTAQNVAKTYPPPFSNFERYCVSRCAGWMACGQEVVKAMSDRGYASKPHCVMPLGVDLEMFAPNPEARRATLAELGFDRGGPPVIGFLGRFAPEKGIGMLMDVLERLRVPWRALFVGAGPMEPRIRAWVARHPDRARVRTDVGHAEVPRFLNAMDILCAPSQTTPVWREQFGRMLIEAFACGVAVVGSDSGEIPHVIGDAGAICPERNLDAWQETIATLLDSPAICQDFSRRGLDRVHQHYSWPHIARRHLAFFDQIIDGGQVAQ